MRNIFFIKLFFLLTFFAQNIFAVQVHNLDGKEIIWSSEEDEKYFKQKRDDVLKGAKTKLAASREISIIITKEGYYPSHISLFQGEHVRFFVTNLSDEPACVMISGMNLFLSAEKGVVTEGETQFEQTGNFPFFCPSTKFNGTVSVIEKRQKFVQRKIAAAAVESILSEESSWTPKDEKK